MRNKWFPTGEYRRVDGLFIIGQEIYDDKGVLLGKIDGDVPNSGKEIMDKLGKATEPFRRPGRPRKEEKEE